MRTQWMTAPRWVHSVVMGAFFAGGVGLFAAWYLDQSPAEVVVGAAIGGVLFGPLMGWFVSNQNESVRNLAALDDRDEFAEAVRAARRGRAPADPRVRAAALRIARHHLQQVESQQRFQTTVFGIATLFYAVLAVVSTPWWALASVAALVFLVGARVMPQRLALRAAALAPEASEGPVTPDRSTNVGLGRDEIRPNG